MSHALLARGVERGEKVVWCGKNSIGVIRLMHAARKIGATAVPLNYRFAPEEAAYVVDNCDAQGICEHPCIDHPRVVLRLYGEMGKPVDATLVGFVPDLPVH